MDIQKMSDFIRVKINNNQLKVLKNMTDIEALDYTWIPYDRLDYIERGEDYVFISDRGINTIDNSVIFTTQDFEMTERDKLFF